MLLCVLATLYYLLMHDTKEREEAEEAIIADEMLISFRSSMHVIRLALFVKNSLHAFTVTVISCRFRISHMSLRKFWLYFEGWALQWTMSQILPEAILIPWMF